MKPWKPEILLKELEPRHTITFLPTVRSVSTILFNLTPIQNTDVLFNLGQYSFGRISISFCLIYSSKEEGKTDKRRGSWKAEGAEENAMPRSERKTVIIWSLYAEFVCQGLLKDCVEEPSADSASCLVPRNPADARSNQRTVVLRGAHAVLR